MTQKKYRSPYSCPSCGWDSGGEYNDIYLEDCYYKLDGEKLEVISVDDLIECKQDPPKDYYPKRTNAGYYDNIDGYGYDWLETWLCPHCKKEFSFNNGT
jgi:hypothetical protein